MKEQRLAANSQPFFSKYIKQIKMSDLIYKEANEHTDKVCEKLFPIIRQALLEAYAKGYIAAQDK